MMNPMGPYRVGRPDAPARWEVKEKHFETVYNQYYRKIYPDLPALQLETGGRQGFDP